MPRRRRRIKSKTCYELCFRARQGLPLVAYRLIDLIIGASVARTQRDDKVTLCHDIWNGSHPHMLVVTKDSEQCTRFYGEIQKRITDAVKRLLGLKHLDLWEGTAMVAEIPDLEAAIERIAYLYANPAQDNLEDCIEKFPGFSSWRAFRRIEPTLGSESTEDFPWLRLPSIPEVPDRPLSSYEDLKVTRELRISNRVRHSLIRKPNAWMSCFGISSEKEIAEVNTRIVERVRAKEAEARASRVKKGKGVYGAHRLRSQKILQSHTPKKKSRKVFVICSINKLRMELIRDFKEFCAECRECLRRWRAGEYSVEWPPGAFKPPLPPLVSLLPG
ncbi:MAG: hypothetical protein K1X83_05720 [Oligoflexia bacterium]|nr:hypothetical protein [Oligoflexia bacterium]